MSLLEKLCTENGISGREGKIIEILKKEWSKYADVEVDEIGNLIAIKKSKKKNAKKIVIAGHMDEIGFVVKHIDDKGFLYLSSRGGNMASNLISQRVWIEGKKNIMGVINKTPTNFIAGCPPEKAKITINDLFVDTGLSEKEVKKIISVGDPIIRIGEYYEQENIIFSKALDNRVGCYVVGEVLKKLAKKNLNVDLYVLASAQEEVGVRGAKTAAKNINPDIGIAVDVTIALDVPGIGAKDRVSELGKGVAIKISDHGSITNQGIIDHFKKLADSNKIKHQPEILPFGGTDAMGLQLLGKGAVGTLSVPTRYVHSATEMLHKKDLDGCIKLLTKFIETADKVKLKF